MKISRITSLIIMLSLLAACDNDEDYTVQFTGSVKYLSDNTLAANIPLQLIIINDDIPVDRWNLNGQATQTNNRALTLSGQSSIDGVYSFEVNSKDLPRNASYLLGLNTDSFLRIDWTNEILRCNTIKFVASELNQRYVANDLTVDYPTYLQITYIKTDHQSLDRIRHRGCLSSTLTSLGNPDTTIIQKLSYFYFKEPYSITYDVLKGSGEFFEYWIENIELRKSDTTKITVNY